MKLKIYKMYSRGKFMLTMQTFWDTFTILKVLKMAKFYCYVSCSNF